MRTILCAFLIVTTACAAPSALSGAQNEDAEAAAMQVMDDFMATFNSKDEDAWAATLNYPHVRIASGTVRVTQNAKEYTDGFDFKDFADRFGWDHSKWDSREIFQSGPDKVHIAVQFSRFDKDDKKLTTFMSLYIVTNDNGHWGVKARSSFAP